MLDCQGARDAFVTLSERDQGQDQARARLGPGLGKASMQTSVEEKRLHWCCLLRGRKLLESKQMKFDAELASRLVGKIVVDVNTGHVAIANI